MMTDKEIPFVDASHTIEDSLQQLHTIYNILVNENSAFEDRSKLTIPAIMNPTGSANPFHNNRSKINRDLDLFDKALSICYSKIPVTQTFKMRRKSGSGYTGNPYIDDSFTYLSDDERRSNLLEENRAAYIFDFATDDKEKNFLDTRSNNTTYLFTYPITNLYTVKAAGRLEPKGAVKEVFLTASRNGLVDDTAINFYNIPSKLKGKIPVWLPFDDSSYGYRHRAIYCHPVTNYLCGFVNNIFSRVPLSQVTSPIVTLPGCDDFNKTVRLDFKYRLVYDYSRFGPSMDNALIDRASFYLAQLFIDYYKITDKEFSDYLKVLMIQNNRPQQLVFSENKKKICYLNIEAGMLDGISRTSTLNSVFNIYLFLVSLKSIGYDYSKLNTLESFRNDSFWLTFVGDGCFCLFKNEELRDKVRSALEKTSSYTFGSSVSFDKSVFCGLRFFENKGFAFDESAVIKPLHPERSARNFKMRPNPRAGLLASMEYFKNIPVDKRLLKPEVVGAIIDKLRSFYDLDFDRFISDGYNPQSKIEDVGYIALSAAGDYDFEYDFSTYYKRYSLGEIEKIIFGNINSSKHLVNKSHLDYINLRLL